MPGAPCNAAVVKPSEYTPLSVLGLIHVQHILRKLGLTSRVQAAVYASDRQRGA